MKFLVSAVGGDIGQTMVKVLRKWDRTGYIFGTDLHDNHVGKLRVDEFGLVPRAADAGYVEAIVRYGKEKNVDNIIPINESEITILHDASLSNLELKKMLIIAGGAGIRSCFDKFECHKFLAKANIPLPWTLLSSTASPEYPCVMKKRKGSGSKGLMILRSEEDRMFFNEREKDYIIQEYLLPDDEEYTCGVFRSRYTSEIRVIILKRKLMGGLTATAEVVNDEEIHDYCVCIANALGLEGSINVQLRLTKKGPRMLEINPRFSSTVGFRDAIGFRDVIWSIQEQNGLVADRYDPGNTLGRKFFRFFDEMYV